MAVRAAMVVCVLGACSPFGGGAFECSLDDQCGAIGRCSGGFCSFPDPDCPSGQRYGALSGPSSRQCVGGLLDGGTIDMPVDSRPTADAASCYGTGVVRACFASTPSGSRTLDSVIDTESSMLCDADPRNAAWCVIAGATIVVQGNVVARGERPLVLVATQTIDVSGTIDVASRRQPAAVGAGGNPSTCGAGTAPGTSGGGAGGSFGGRGGNGGGGAAQNTGGTSAVAMAMPTTARGGCAGQNGNGNNAGTGGAGGGAVVLIAETSITITGSINASGAGATSGANMASGGGGGGSGGLIGLDAPAVTNNGLVIANGGGGGEGSGTNNTGAPGGDPIGTAGGLGGAGLSTSGGDGGNGAGGATLTGTNGSNGTGGGGGGGGGAGLVLLDRAASIGGGGTISPPAT